MAILKIVEAPNGATGQYNKIHKVDIYGDTDQSVVITTNIYESVEAYNEGKQILWQERTTVPFTAFLQDPRNIFYQVLNEYSYSPFKDGTADEPDPSTDRTIELTADAKADIDFGSTIPSYNPGTGATEVFPPWDTTEIAADGVALATCTGLPNPTKIEFIVVPASVSKPAPIIETSGTFSFATTVPGTYTIRMSGFPYIERLTTIIAS